MIRNAIKKLNVRSRNIDDTARELLAISEENGKKITVSQVAKILEINVGLFKEYIDGKKIPNNKDRRKIEMFFGKDMFPEIPYENETCLKCKTYKDGQCGGQPYFVQIFMCKNRNKTK